MAVALTGELIQKPELNLDFSHTQHCDKGDLNMKNIYSFLFLALCVILFQGACSKTKVRAINGGLVSGGFSVDDAVQVDLTGIKVGSAEIGDLMAGEISGYEKVDEGSQAVTAASGTVFTNGVQAFNTPNQEMPENDQVFIFKDKKNSVFLDPDENTSGGTNYFTLSPSAAVEFEF